MAVEHFGVQFMVSMSMVSTSVDSARGVVPGDGQALLPRVSVVIPALNEAANLVHVLPLIPDWIYEVILVDGHSTDGTVGEARRLRPGIRIVTQSGSGKGAALRTGFAVASGDIIVTLDADGSTEPGEIAAFVQLLLEGADFVKGSRFLAGGGTSDMPFYRKCGNGAFVLLLRILFGGRFTDLCYGYNAFWTRVLPQLTLDCDGFEIETLMNVRALRAGLDVREVPSFESKRVYGSGRLRTIPDGWRLPTMKTHVFTGTTGAMKNAFGGLLHDDRHWAHASIHETIVDLLTIQREIHPGLFAVMDGTIAGDGPGPRATRPHIANLLLASDDMVAIDAVAAKLMGLDPFSLKYIRLAHERGLGCGDVREIDWRGDDVSDVNLGFTNTENTLASRG